MRRFLCGFLLPFDYGVAPLRPQLAIYKAPQRLAVIWDQSARVMGPPNEGFRVLGYPLVAPLGP